MRSCIASRSGRSFSHRPQNVATACRRASAVSESGGRVSAIQVAHVRRDANCSGRTSAKYCAWSSASRRAVGVRIEGLYCVQDGVPVPQEVRPQLLPVLVVVTTVLDFLVGEDEAAETHEHRHGRRRGPPNATKRLDVLARRHSRHDVVRLAFISHSKSRRREPPARGALSVSASSSRRSSTASAVAGAVASSSRRSADEGAGAGAGASRGGSATVDAYHGHGRLGDRRHRRRSAVDGHEALCGRDD